VSSLTIRKQLPPRARPAARPAAVTRREAWIRRLPLLPALIYVIVVTQIPFLVTLYYSFQSWNLLQPGSRHFAGVANYATVFTDPTFRTAIVNTVELTGVSVVISMVLGVALAMLLDRKFFGRGVVRTLLITPFLVMPVATALLWKTTMLDPIYGLVNFILSPFGVHHVAWVSQFPMGSIIAVLVWEWTPFMMLIELSGLQSQPRDLIEAARVDGAGAWAIFRKLTFPHLRPYIELGILLGSIYVVNTFGEIYMITQGGPGTATTNLPYYLYEKAFQAYDIGTAAADGVVTVAGTLIVAMVALRLISTVFRLEGGRA